MASPAMVKLFLPVLFTLIAFIKEIETSLCHVKSSTWPFNDLTYSSTWPFNDLTYSYRSCPYGCCGSYSNDVCCSFPTSIMIGSVAGGVVFIVVIITIVCCCCRNRQGTTGTVIQSTNGVPVVIQQSGMNTSYVPPPMYQPNAYQPNQPNAYQPNAYQPNAYQANAYPPTTGQEMTAPKNYAQPPPSYNDPTATAYDNHGCS